MIKPDEFNADTSTIRELIKKMVENGGSHAAGVIPLSAQYGCRFRFELVEMEQLTDEHDALLAWLLNWRQEIEVWKEKGLMTDE